ncbi:MAG: hypothetical protein LBK06_00135 [Planctomycetaceae bacterium]|nr:hypothetical protein [Planctomycetaceae bacterium]
MKRLFMGEAYRLRYNQRTEPRSLCNETKDNIPSFCTFFVQQLQLIQLFFRLSNHKTAKFGLNHTLKK